MSSQSLDLPAEEVTAGQLPESSPGYPHRLPRQDFPLPPVMPRLPGDPERLSTAWSLAVPSWDVWVWRDVNSIIISDPTFLLINREKISGKGNCSSYIAVSGLLVFLAWVVVFFFVLLYVPCRKNYLSLWGQIPRLDLSKIFSVSFCLNKGVRVSPRSRKGQKPTLHFTVKQAEPTVPAHRAERCQAMLNPAHILPSAKEGSVPAKSRTPLQRASRESQAALKSNLTVPWASDTVSGRRDGSGRDATRADAGRAGGVTFGARIPPRAEVSGGHLHRMAG